ncbi:hypothetical protein [Flavobacterium sp. U410]
MENLKEKLNLLKKEKDELKFLYDVSKPSEKEMVDFIKKNQSKLARLKEIEKEIKEIEWQLMSEKEKQEYFEYQKKIKEKYSDD